MSLQKDKPLHFKHPGEKKATYKSIYDIANDAKLCRDITNADIFDYYISN